MSFVRIEPPRHQGTKAFSETPNDEFAPQALSVHACGPSIRL
jgi:hypothetical protein